MQKYKEFFKMHPHDSLNRNFQGMNGSAPVFNGLQERQKRFKAKIEAFMARFSRLMGFLFFG